MSRLTIRVEACTEILAILITMAWADGKLEDKEKASIRSAATVLNLTKDLRSRLDKMLESPIPLDQVLVQNLGAHDRAFAYVAAVWQMGVDGDNDPREKDRLRELRALLEVDVKRASELEKFAQELGRPHEKHGWAHDLAALFKAIPHRLDVPFEEADEVEG
ncbi:MAG: TerB family tellurite resistance protein [Polyangiaceae bacterium]|jgi:uncharacterized membrane protein YebE (DUF533 family)|nr:TerB family tellurite resistance protein [Polyangiaceae bacterium]